MGGSREVRVEEAIEDGEDREGFESVLEFFGLEVVELVASGSEVVVRDTHDLTVLEGFNEFGSCIGFHRFWFEKK
jgi:hypothetical protein